MCLYTMTMLHMFLKNKIMWVLWFFGGEAKINMQKEEEVIIDNECIDLMQQCIEKFLKKNN